jgi:hypothetical protein
MLLGWGKQEEHATFWSGKLSENGKSQNREGDKTVILSWVLGKWVIRDEGGRNWLRIVSEKWLRYHRSRSKYVCKVFLWRVVLCGYRWPEEPYRYL